MPTPRFTTLLIQLLERKLNLQRSSGGLTAGTDDFFVKGQISIVKGTGELEVSIQGGRTVTAKPSTDERFISGQQVWISRTQEGNYIVHGGVR